MQLGLFLKRYRKGASLSGKQLAIRLGISKHVLEKYENAGVMPGYKSSRKILQLFELNDLEDISENELDQCLRNVLVIENDDENEEGKNCSSNLHQSLNYEAILAEKEKRIAQLEEMVQLLREQIRFLKRR